MSEEDPLDDGFGGIPFLGDLARMFGQGGGMPWDNARQVAVSVATEGRSEANVDPMERMRIEQLARVAELHVANLTGLATAHGDGAVTVVPATRTTWATQSLDAYRPLLERLSSALSPEPSDLGELDELDDPHDPMASMMSGVLRMLQPMMLAVTAGSMVGHLAQRSLGQYDLPIPRPRGRGEDELLLIVPNLDEFAEEWSLPADDLRLWICVHELAHHAVLGVPHVRARLDDLLVRYVSSFTNDFRALEDRIGHIDPTDPGALEGLQEAIGSPDVILGAITSPEQQRLRPELDAIVAVVVGTVDHVLDHVGGSLISDYNMLTEALRRRRVEAAEADRFVERLFGLELTQSAYDRGARFVDGVVERAGDDGLHRLWTSEANLPTPAEVDAPGLWLARLDLELD